jgi:hypothetical protein
MFARKLGKRISLDTKQQMLSLWSKNWTGLIMSCGATGRCIVLYQRKTRSIQKEAQMGLLQRVQPALFAVKARSG